MSNTSLVEKASTHEKLISLATASDAESIYEVLCEAFRDNREMSISDFSVWSKSFHETTDRHVYLWKEQEQLSGFAILIETRGHTELRTVGVRLNSRGRGIGAELIQHCLNKTLKLGYQESQLNVAVENAKALGLYQRLGFKVTENYNCYRADFSR